MGDSMSKCLLIANYKIEARRATGDGGYIRALRLALEPTEELYKTILIVFFEENLDKLGIQSPSEGSVIVTLPVKDFHDMYQILQTEAPVFADWLADDEHNLKSFSLRTYAEPLGEGPADIDYIPLHSEK
jgi:hypothetical protein